MTSPTMRPPSLAASSVTRTTIRPAALAAPGTFTLASTAPLLLLPVRIETAFVDDPKTGKQLWLRIYPDQIAIDSHDLTLTQAEWNLAQAYWAATVWTEAPSAAGWADDQQAAWMTLAQALGPQRAAYVANVTAPANFDTWIAAPPGPLGNPVQPTPPQPLSSLRATSWENPPLARALPTTWFAVLCRNQAPEVCVRVDRPPADLITGLDPGAAGTADDPDGTKGMRWLTDFDTAVQAGMAVRIPLSDAQFQAGFDQVVVMGATTSTPQAGQQTLENLLAAHRFTDGFSLIAQGTPTKNSTDSTAGYSRIPGPTYTASFQAERQAPLIDTTPAASPLYDGHYFADALGISRDTLAHTPLAGGTDQPDAIAAATLLWPATGGYTIPYMLGYQLNDKTMGELRQFATTFLRGRGPLPAFQIGNLPYGLLPAMSTTSPLPPIGDSPVAAKIAALIQAARPLWLAGLDDTTSPSADPDKAILQVLSSDAATSSLSAVLCCGPQFQWNLAQYLQQTGNTAQGQATQATYQQGISQTAAQLHSLGLAATPAPAAQALFLQPPIAANLTMVSPTDPTVDTNPGNLANLFLSSFTDLWQTVSAFPSVLSRLAARALLLEYATLAAGILGVTISDPEYLPVGSGALGPLLSVTASATVTAAMAASIGGPAPQSGEQLGDYLHRWWQILTAPGSTMPSLLQNLQFMYASAASLAPRSPASLQRLLAETLDVWAYRLDAWWTAVCTAELQAMRATVPNGVLLGCYGYVEAVQPATAQSALTAQQLSALNGLIPGGAAPLAPRSDNGGFVYAPSLAQATTGAVLRNGYLTHLANGEAPAFQIDLSSAKVRTALQLLEGLRQGQHLGALLGYQFEAALLAGNLAGYIPIFRDLYPIVANKLTGSGTPGLPAASLAAASNVVDGAALQQASINQAIPWGSSGLPAANATGQPEQDYQNLTAALGELDATVAAVSDLSVAESIFQIVRGNPSRSGGMLDASSRDQHPPQPQVITTPRGGLDFPQRVLSAFNVNPGTPPVSAWQQSAPASPRATAEPYLEGWLAAMLPPPAQVQFVAEWELETPGRSVITLAQAGISALDLMALTPPPPPDGSLAGTEVTGSQLEGYLLGQATLTSQIPVLAHGISAVYDRADPDLQAAPVTVPELLLLTRALAELVGMARPLLPADLAPPSGQMNPPGQFGLPSPNIGDAGDLQTRLTAGAEALGLFIGELTAAVNAPPPSPSPQDPLPQIPATGQLIGLLLTACSFADPSAAPATVDRLDFQALQAQAQAVLGRLQARTRQLQADLAFAAQSPASLAAIQTAARDLFGPGFVLLPLTEPSGAVATYLPQLVEAAAAWQNQVATAPAAPGALATATVMQQLTHVRPAVAQLDQALTLSTLLSGTTVPTFDVAQLPYTSGAPWLGTAVPDSFTTPGQYPWDTSIQGSCALLLWSPFGPLSATAPTGGVHVCGLVFDEWAEQIPNNTELSAVALHYEEPTARAPQTLLLALPPPGASAWNAQLLLETIQETITWAKARTVDTDSLPGLGQVLPALYTASNTNPFVTIPTELGNLAH
jgi:hypothetical protein